MSAFGSTVTVTVQLVGVNGLRAVPPEDGASYTIIKEAYSSIDAPATTSSRLTQRSTEVVAVDSTGKIEFILEGDDPESNDTGDTAPDEILWRYTVTAEGDSPPLDEPVENVQVVFTELIRWHPQSTCQRRSSTCVLRDRVRARPATW